MTEENGTPELEYSVLVVDDEESIRITLTEALRSNQIRVSAVGTGEQALKAVESGDVDLVLLDQNLKETGENGIDVLRSIKERRAETLVIMMTAYGSIDNAVEATKLGCYQYLTKPLQIAQLRLLIDSALGTLSLRKEVEYLRSEREREFEGERIFGSSEKMRELLGSVRKIAQAGTSTVLIRGETGTGKELIARMLHFWGVGSKGAFIDVNCAAFPDNLLESELFGYEAGAFTDARKSKRGLVEMADRGTLFLDEIGEMPLALQSKLLRVLESKRLRRLGATTDVKVSCRFVAATNKDLFQEVEAKRFREDLYYRLSVIPVHVPPLRERTEDVTLLAKYFLEKYARELGGRVERFSEKALELICGYPWPGNVRELKNVMERIALMHSGTEVLPGDLPDHVRGGGRTPAGAGSGASGGGDEIRFPSDRIVPLERVERAAILDALRKADGNKTRAADLLGISRQTLRTKLKEYEIADAPA